MFFNVFFFVFFQGADDHPGEQPDDPVPPNPACLTHYPATIPSGPNPAPLNPANRAYAEVAAAAVAAEKAAVAALAAEVVAEVAAAAVLAIQ